ncbi:MAG TPA: zinc ribbon domain-containing protein [Bacteroidales bacterium]|nr:zinc ribbon domain-containing protein [Bacteroidales bacterium]HPS72826.1 zinc ribbon domain-containing protein [Bacteroidales bacterium]
MSEKIKFSRNYHDLSTDTGYQFEFFCDHCGNGFRSTFQGSFSGRASKFLNAASTLFGGALGSVSSAGNSLRDAGWERAHDKAFMEAVEELTPFFIQCPNCKKWVCREDCWNLKKGLCKDCAPDLGVEMAKAQSDRSVEEIHAHAAMAEEDKKLDTAHWRENIKATCPKCEAPLATNAKFCPECGAKIKAEDNCPACGAKLTPNAKFCPECGEKI